MDVCDEDGLRQMSILFISGRLRDSAFEGVFSLVCTYLWNLVVT